MARSTLQEYRRKRDFKRTAEPSGREGRSGGDLFVVQKHAARRLHYDLRLELDGTLKSWSVPKGPSLDPAVRRLAVHVEDHPLEYGDFEGVIPAGEYGAGEVIVWDRGVWVPEGDAAEGYRKGDLKFRLAGHKLRGGWKLIRTARQDGGKEQWLLIKARDDEARKGPEGEIVDKAPSSVLSNRTIEDFKEKPEAPRKRRRKAAPARLASAVPADLPAWLRPQLPTLVPAPPGDSGWLHEIKFDGYRTACRISERRARMIARGGGDWTDRYRVLAAELGELPCRTALIDGEVVVQEPDGVTSFALLQQALADDAGERMLFFAFDLLHLDGYDLTAAPLRERKALLSDLVAGAGTAPIHFSEHVEAPGPEVLARACTLSLEGVVSKRADAPYRPGRSTAWLKAKCRSEGVFPVIGYTKSAAAGGLAALLVARQDAAGLRYAGRVGAGLSTATAETVHRALAAAARLGPPLPIPASASIAGVTWVEPVFAAEVEYAGFTADGLLRHAVFRGLKATPAAKAARPAAPPPRRFVTDAALAGITVTNPDRPMFGGPTKLDLALYYAKVGDWALPHLIDRPLTLLRCPTGEAPDCFYQRHFKPGMPAAVRRIVTEKRGRKGGAEEETVAIADVEGLLGLAQFGVVEFHPWGARGDRPDRPDRIVFDLDPDPSVAWPAVVAAAFALRGRLQDLGLPCFVKTTGGKGLHLVVPLRRRHGWDTVGAFARAFAETAATGEPRRYTANLSKARRTGRIFIDHLRNIRGATAIGPYSLRARPGAPVATPLDWDELDGLDDPRTLDYATVPARLARRGSDPWAQLDAVSGVLTKDILATVGVRG